MFLKKEILIIMILAGIFSGCATHTVISHTYNFNNMKRIGILKVDVNNAPLEGVEGPFRRIPDKEWFYGC